jgi:pimeloyl-[acyl-carrier protein] methyl ester esterase
VSIADRSGIFTHTLGTGPDIVLLHGWGLNSGVWDDILPALGAEHRVTMMDLPGHGRSSTVSRQAHSPGGGSAGGGDRVDSGAILQAMAGQLAAAAPRRAAWMGWSLGGMAALQVASQSPGRVEKLILISCNARFSRCADWPHAMDPKLIVQFAEELKSDYEGTLHRFLALQLRGSERERETQRSLRRSLMSGGKLDTIALCNGLAVLRDADLRAEFSRIACPCLLVLGERDTLVPVEAGEAMKNILAHARVTVIAGAGHAPFLSHSSAFLQAVLEFLHD